MPILLLILSLLAPLAHAVDRNPVEFPDEAQQERFWRLANELRCVVCQNQSVADSNAAIAQDVRDIVREMILDGNSDAEIFEFLVDRYSDYVLYNPPLRPSTYFLWLGPAVLLFLGLIWLFLVIRNHANSTRKATALTAEEQQRIQQVLNNQG